MAKCNSYEECTNPDKKEECDLHYTGCGKGAPAVIGEVDKALEELAPGINERLSNLDYGIEGWSVEKVGGEGTPFEEQWTLSVCISPIPE
jgi:hypothetical protein